MSIAPIVRTVIVKASPQRAFDAFTADIGQWWPKNHQIGAQPFAQVVMEPRVGGRWFERDADGAETSWGKVLAWDPPGRVVLVWQISTAWAYDPGLLTEVEMSFAAQADGTTLVTLEHRKLELFGEGAESMANQLGNGWPGTLQAFADYAGR
jgi:uncharacterized protein YndB with AHSA1/START domain